MLIPEKCHPWAEIQRPNADYASSVAEDFRQIEPFLPSEVSSILDIGCGLAGIDVYLKRKYPNARLELLDGGGTADMQPRYDYDGNKPYCSRAATELLLEANGVKVDRWHDVGTQDLRADLVISLLSWGFHFPLSAYRVSGFCIADIRRGREKVDGQVIYRAEKYDRTAFRCSF